MKYLSLLLLLYCNFLFSQDTIVKKNGEIILVKIQEIKKQEIHYTKFDSSNGSTFLINKNQLSEIRFEDGKFENFGSEEQNVKSLQETKDFIVKMFNQYCYERDSDKRRYKAAFEGDYLRLIVMNKSGTKEVNSGLQWDFANVYKFQRASKKENNVAYLNIWMEFISNEKKDTHKKNKLVVQVRGYDEADQILLALRHLNKLLLEQKPQSEKF